MEAVQDIPVSAKVGNTPSRTTIVQVPKVDARELPYDEFLKKYVATNQPVVIQNAAPGWSALRNWTPEYFRDNYGEQNVEVTYGVRSKMADVMDGVLASTKEKPGPYLHKVIIHHHMPQLLPALAPENVYAFPGRFCSPLMPKRFHRPDGYLKLLIGGPGGKFPLMHFDSDNAHALITEIYGDKEFVLFPPEDSPYVYPHATSPSTSQIDDLDHVDLARFPEFPKATQYRTILQPNETIFVPSRWWHAARVVTTSVSVCTNMIHSTNWNGFVKISCESSDGKLTPQARIKQLYLRLAGVIMGVAEGIQKAFPRSAFARLAGRISPASPAARPS
ncbi:MAG TPA: cupin-like domain-containing protein [Acidobacteriaceae bacterium]